MDEASANASSAEEEGKRDMSRNSEDEAQKHPQTLETVEKQRKSQRLTTHTPKKGLVPKTGFALPASLKPFKKQFRNGPGRVREAQKSQKMANMKPLVHPKRQNSLKMTKKAKDEIRGQA